MNEKKIERILDPRFGEGEYEIASKFNEIIDVVNSLAKDMNSKEKCPHGEMFASRCHYCLDELGKTEKVPDLIIHAVTDWENIESFIQKTLEADRKGRNRIDS